MPNVAKYEVFSKNLKYAMRIKHKTQMDLMKHLGFPSATVSSWVNGLRLPRMDKLKLLADYLEVDISALLEDWMPKESISGKGKELLDKTEKEGDLSHPIDILLDTLANPEDGVLNYKGMPLTSDEVTVLRSVLGLALKDIKKREEEKR